MVEATGSLAWVLGIALILAAGIFYLGFLVGYHKGWEKGWSDEQEFRQQEKTMWVSYPASLEEAEEMRDRGEK